MLSNDWRGLAMTAPDRHAVERCAGLPAASVLCPTVRILLAVRGRWRFYRQQRLALSLGAHLRRDIGLDRHRADWR
jgi:uncharacterized protein YjiS (DUF1127 family)